MTPISFLVNTSINTIDHVKLLIRSLKENLYHKEHEVLVFVDSDNEGTVDYLKQQKGEFFDLKIITHSLKPCVGYSRNNNLLVELAKHEVVAYLQSDMVISKNYDLDVLKDLEDNCILCATRIEPPLHGESYTTITKDFGVDPNEFKWSEFISFAETQKMNKQIEYFFAPFIFYKRVWLEAGGYDTLFRRSREDSDILQRFIHRGVKIKQTFNANVYHFSCVSSRGKNWFDQKNQSAKERVELQKIADQVELRRFIRKWGGFNHGENKLEKLDIDLVLLNDIQGKENMIASIEPFFTRVWVKNEEQKNLIISRYKIEHYFANRLLNFTDQDWENSKKFYNTIDYNKIYHVGSPQQFSAKFVLNTDKLQDSDDILSNLQNLTHLIRSYESGKYEYGAWIIEINAIVCTSDRNVIHSNPPFDYDLLNFS